MNFWVKVYYKVRIDIDDELHNFCRDDCEFNPDGRGERWRCQYSNVELKFNQSLGLFQRCAKCLKAGEKAKTKAAGS